MSERGSTTTLNNTSRTRRRAYSLSLFFFGYIELYLMSFQDAGVVWACRGFRAANPWRGRRIKADVDQTQNQLGPSLGHWAKQTPVSASRHRASTHTCSVQ